LYTSEAIIIKNIFIKIEKIIKNLHLTLTVMTACAGVETPLLA